MFEILWEKYIQHRIDIMADFYNLFLASEVTAVAAGWVFELRMHQLLVKKQTITLYPVHGHYATTNLRYNDYTSTKEKQDPLILNLAQSKELPLIEGSTLQHNCYYRPKSPNFPTIDSLLLTGKKSTPILLMLQMTRNNNEHDVNQKGLDAISKLGIEEAQRYYVVVTPEGIHPTITAAMEDFPGVQQREPADELFPVYHYSVPLEKLF